MTPGDADTALAVLLAEDFPIVACDVEVPWLWGDVHDPTTYTLCGHVDPDGSITNMRLRPDGGGWVEPVPPAFDAMARCDLRDAAAELWGKR